MSHSSPHDDSHSRSWKPRAEPPASLAFVPMNASAFLVLMADALRLREETLAMAFVYTNRYLRFLRDHPLTDELLDEHVRRPILPTRTGRAADSHIYIHRRCRSPRSRWRPRRRSRHGDYASS